MAVSKNKNTYILKKIYRGIEAVRPFLVADGGDLEFVEVTEDNIVRVKLTGACKECPFNVMTLKAGIEQAIKKEWTSLKGVEAV